MVEGTSPEESRMPAATILSVAVLALALFAPPRLEGQQPTQEPEDTVLVPQDTVLVPQDTVLVPVGPLQPDIYVADLSVFDGLYFLGPLQNVTNRAHSYDNQPMCTPDSRSLLYVTEYGYGDRVQTEIQRYYLSSRHETRITMVSR